MTSDQRNLDATSENGADHEEDSQSGEAAEWADRHPRAAGAVSDPSDESADDPATSGSPELLSSSGCVAMLNSHDMIRNAKASQSSARALSGRDRQLWCGTWRRPG